VGKKKKEVMRKKDDKSSIMPLLLIGALAVAAYYFFNKDAAGATPQPGAAPGGIATDNSGTSDTAPFAQAPPLTNTAPLPAVIDVQQTNPDIDYLNKFFPEMYTYYPQMTADEIATMKEYVSGYVIKGTKPNPFSSLFIQLMGIESKYHVKFL
jgi:hypothetical protein